MEISPDILPIILSNVITAAALGGVLWQKVTSNEQHTASRLDALREHTDEQLNGIRSGLRGLEKQVRDQNGRVTRLERWKARREGYQSGLEDGDQDHYGG